MAVTPVNQRASVAAQFVEDLPDDAVPAGAFSFYVRYGDPAPAPKAGLLFGCPCGCGEGHSVAFSPAREGRPSWNWDGNESAPTLTPSINILQFDDAGNQVGEHWHGFLTAGQFVSC